MIRDGFLLKRNTPTATVSQQYRWHSTKLDEDHLESKQREAELVKSVEEINQKQRKEDRQKKEKETSELYAIAVMDDALRMFIENNGDAAKKAVTKKTNGAIFLLRVIIMRTKLAWWTS